MCLRILVGTIFLSLLPVVTVAADSFFEGIWVDELPDENLSEVGIVRKCLNSPIAVTRSGEWIGFKAQREVEIHELLDLSTISYEQIWSTTCSALRNVDVCPSNVPDRPPGIFLSERVNQNSFLQIQIDQQGNEQGRTPIFRCDIRPGQKSDLWSRLEEAAGRSLD